MQQGGDPLSADTQVKGLCIDQWNSFPSQPVVDSLTSAVNLASSIRSLQKNSKTFGEVWETYCQALGQGLCDPSGHDSRFLDNFFIWLINTAVPGVQSPTLP